MPNKGDRFVYEPQHGTGFGHSARGEELTAEMTALDLAPGTEVSYLEDDQDSGWPLVEWVDSVNIDRITTIDPDIFRNDFIPA
jgi:hypothetical protein